MTTINPHLAEAIRDRYELERELGQGGMATVYLAQDLKHGRRVAVKVLRPELAATLGPSRFFREIEIAAQLQHPHILPLLDSGEAEGYLYYVMPYVDGESLRERLDRSGEFPVVDAVRILAEVAEALAYAHARGVVHRDIKPENIMLAGRHPLVMDFGVAKAVSPVGTSREVMTEGIALGTPAYMAPEQAAADPHLDHRVDIYALGVIGYELLTGEKPFRGRSAQQILAVQMTERPEPIARHRPSIPAALATILMRCLERRPADRPQSANEIVNTLETMITPGEGITPRQSSPAFALGGSRWRRALLMGMAFIIVAVTGLLWRKRPPTVKPVVATQMQLTFAGNVEHQDLSPDGQFLTYIERGETARLLVRDLTSSSVIPIAALGQMVMTLRWSPDGSSILHAGQDSSGQWMTVLFPRLGGSPRRLSGAAGFSALSRDGSRMADWSEIIGSPIYILTLTTNTWDSIAVPDSVGHRHQGDWSPDGRWIAFQSGAEAGNRWMLWAADVGTGQLRQILRDTIPLSPPRWSPSGESLYFIRNENELCKIDFSPSDLRAGVPEVLQTGVAASDFSVTADGTRLAYRRRQPRSNLWLATKSLSASRFVTTQLTSGTSLKGGPRTSPDGRLVAFVRLEQGGGDVYVVPVEGGAPRQVTASGVAVAPGVDYGTPAWSPDGRRLAYIGAIQGVTRVRVVEVEGGRERTYELTQVGEGLDLAWSPRERILYHRPGNRNFHWLDPTNGDETPLVTNDSVGWMFRPLISPDGQQVAVTWNRQPNPGVYLISVKDGVQTHVGPPFAVPLGWSSDGASIYLEEQSSRRIHRISTRGRRSVFIGMNPFKRPVGDLGSCELNELPSAISLLCSVDESVSDVWMMENFDPAHQRSE